MIRLVSLSLCLSIAAVVSCAAQQTPERKPVKLGEPDEEVDQNMIGLAVRASPMRFQRCYQDARERNPSLAGQIEVRFVIQKDGTVGPAMLVETDLPPPVADCVVDAWYGLVLEEQEDPVIAQYPMFFEPS